MRIVNSVKACIESTFEKSSTNATAAFSGLFKCVICFQSRPNSLYACPFCGRYLGCFSCLSNVDKCPLCRKKFSCLKCKGILARNPLLIPDIENLVDIPQTRMCQNLRLSLRILTTLYRYWVLITQNSHQMQTLICDC